MRRMKSRIQELILKVKFKLIKLLGGYTGYEYSLGQKESYDEGFNKATDIERARSAETLYRSTYLQDLPKPVSYAVSTFIRSMELQHYYSDPRFKDMLLNNICQNLGVELCKNNLVTFDLDDCFEHDSKVLRARITVIPPKEVTKNFEDLWDK